MLDYQKLQNHRIQTEKEIDDAIEKYDAFVINRPCGYGKTYQIIQQCKKRQGKKVIIEPTTALKDYVEKYTSTIKDVTICTYSSLLHKSREEFIEIFGNIDYMFFDEVHRIGAEKWGEAVKTLRDTFKSAKVIGMSATPIRNDGKNVIDLEFKGTQINPLYLNDAIIEELLPNPCYVASLYAIDEYFQEQIDFIETSKRIGEEDKPLIVDEIKNNCLEYKKLYNIPNILQKYILLNSKYKHNMKFIVFIRKVDEIQQTEQLSHSWFTEAFSHMGKKINLYNVNYLNTRTENQQIINSFEEEHNDNEIDIMVSVNMFNEGIHLSNITGVILLRKTQSDIVYFQQIGRAIDASGKTPIIFDFVNNYKYISNGYISLFKNKTSDIGNKTLCRTISGEVINIHDDGKDFLDLIKVKFSNKEKWNLLLENKNIIKEMLENKKSFREISKHFHLSHSIIKSFAYSEFPDLVQFEQKYTKTYLSNDEIELLKQNCNNWTIIEAAKALNRHSTTIRTFSEATGIKFKENSIWLTSDEKKEIITLRKEGKTIREISLQIHRSPTAIRGVLNKNNLNNNKAAKPITKKQKEFLKENIDKGIEWNIKETGLKESQIIRFYQKEQLLNYNMLKKLGKRRPISQEEIDYINGHKEDGISNIAKALNRSKDFVKNVAKNNNINIKLIDNRRKVSKEDVIKINDEYHNNKESFSYKECAKKYNVSVGAIQYIVKDKLDISMTDEEKNFIIQNHTIYTVIEFSKIMKRGCSTIRKVLKENKLTPLTKSNIGKYKYNSLNVPKKIKNKIKEEYTNQNLSQKMLSNKYNISLYSISKILNEDV